MSRPDPSLTRAESSHVGSRHGAAPTGAGNAVERAARISCRSGFTPRFRQLALAVGAALALVASLPAATRVGDTFPALTNAGLVNLTTGPLPALHGKVTLVDFWASWCAPCKASFPAMAGLYAEFAARGFQVVAISVDDKPAAAAAFWRRMAPPFVGVHDRSQKLVAQVAVPTMPTSYLVDREGHVRYIHSGFHGEVAELRAQIEELLGAAVAGSDGGVR